VSGGTRNARWGKW